MLKAAAQNGWIDEQQVVLEQYFAACIVFGYFQPKIFSSFVLYCHFRRQQLPSECWKNQPPRIEVLKKIPAKIRFLSIEPLLEDLKIR
jgi:hypothetical protein